MEITMTKAPNRQEILVNTPRVAYDEMKTVPGASYDSAKDNWTLPLTWASCVTMRMVFGGYLRIESELADWAREQKKIHLEIDELRTARSASFPASYVGEDFKLYDYQKAGAKYLTMQPYGILGDDMRVGKTPQVLRALRWMHEHDKDVFPLIIICPPLVKSVWRREIANWWPQLRVEIPKSGIAAAEKAVNAVISGEADAVVLHYEIIALVSNLAGYGSEKKVACKECVPEVRNADGEMVANTIQPSKCHIHKKVLNQIDWNAVVCDEVHRITEPSAQMTRAVWQISSRANVRWGLTGTFPEDPDRVWCGMRFAYPAEYPSKTKFRDMFVNWTINPYSGFPESLGWRNQTRDTFDSFFTPRFFRRPRSVVHDVVEPITTLLEPEMTPKQTKAYKDLKQNFFAELDGGIFWAEDPGSKMQRLRQLASAYGELMEDNQIILSEPSSKLDALEELLLDLGEGQVVVFAEQKQLIELGMTRLGDRAVKLVGGMSDSARENSVTRFQNGDVQYILATTATGGEGISLNAADTLIFLQRPWSRKDNKQSEDRIYMEGRPSWIYELRTPGTVEERVADTLARKNEKFEDLVRDADTLKEWLG